MFGYLQVMLGVDRLDMIKGIPQKILAFEKFLEENPNWRDKVVLLQIAVPTRTDVPECMFPSKYISFFICSIIGYYSDLEYRNDQQLELDVQFLWFMA